MKVCGIVAEYNPLHNGHVYQLKYVRESLGADFIVVCISGDFVQRGEPAVVDKYTRARMALLAGADLVLEMPVQNACGSAEFFASGGVSVLDSLGVVDRLCFGAEDESADSGRFMNMARLLSDEPEVFRDEIKRAAAEGLTFAVARERALKKAALECMTLSEERKNAPGSLNLGEIKSEVFRHENDRFLSSPNNILGVEYCKSLFRRESNIIPVPLPRIGAGYHSESLDRDGFSSASAIRKLVYEASKVSEPSAGSDKLTAELCRQMPEQCAELLYEAFGENRLLFAEDLDQVLFYQLLKEDIPGIFEYQDVTEELGRRILKLRGSFRGFSQFSGLVKSKNYTLTRIRRALLHILLGIRDADVHHDAAFCRVLGFRKSSVPLLSAIKQKSRIPLITRPSGYVLSPEAKRQYLLHVQASNIYEALVSQKCEAPFVHEFSRQPVIIP